MLPIIIIVVPQLNKQKHKKKNFSKQQCPKKIKEKVHHHNFSHLRLRIASQLMFENLKNVDTYRQHFFVQNEVISHFT
jgi:hypothetical protein